MSKARQRQREAVKNRQSKTLCSAIKFRKIIKKYQSWALWLRRVFNVIIGSEGDGIEARRDNKHKQ